MLNSFISAALRAKASLTDSIPARKPSNLTANLGNVPRFSGFPAGVQNLFPSAGSSLPDFKTLFGAPRDAGELPRPFQRLHELLKIKPDFDREDLPPGLVKLVEALKASRTTAAPKLENSTGKTEFKPLFERILERPNTPDLAPGNNPFLILGTPRFQPLDSFLNGFIPVNLFSSLPQPITSAGASLKSAYTPEAPVLTRQSAASNPTENQSLPLSSSTGIASLSTEANRFMLVQSSSQAFRPMIPLQNQMIAAPVQNAMLQNTSSSATANVSASKVALSMVRPVVTLFDFLFQPPSQSGIAYTGKPAYTRNELEWFLASNGFIGLTPEQSEALEVVVDYFEVFQTANSLVTRESVHSVTNQILNNLETNQVPDLDTIAGMLDKFRENGTSSVSQPGQTISSIQYDPSNSLYTTGRLELI